MKLLFDENLSHRLVALLADAYPGSVHVRDAGLSGAQDADVWRHAREQGLCIVSKDSDFHDRSIVLGPPPKVVWLQRGNCSTREIESILRRHREDLAGFNTDPNAAFLVLT